MAGWSATVSPPAHRRLERLSDCIAATPSLVSTCSPPPSPSCCRERTVRRCSKSSAALPKTAVSPTTSRGEAADPAVLPDNLRERSPSGPRSSTRCVSSYSMLRIITTFRLQRRKSALCACSYSPSARYDRFAAKKGFHLSDLDSATSWLVTRGRKYVDVREEELTANDRGEQSVALGLTTLQIAVRVEENVLLPRRPDERLVVSEELEEELQEDRSRLVDPGNGHCGRRGRGNLRRSQMLYSGSSEVDETGTQASSSERLRVRCATNTDADEHFTCFHFATFRS